MVKHCCYGVCKSDNRKILLGDPSMEGVIFLPFPKPDTQMEKCLRWISLCGRPKKTFNISKINKGTYIYSPLHRRAQQGTLGNFFILIVFVYIFRAENDAAGRFLKKCAQSAFLGPGFRMGVK